MTTSGESTDDLKRDLDTGSPFVLSFWFAAGIVWGHLVVFMTFGASLVALTKFDWGHIGDGAADWMLAGCALIWVIVTGAYLVSLARAAKFVWDSNATFYLGWGVVSAIWVVLALNGFLDAIR